MAERGPKEPKREDAGVSGTSLLNASGGSMIDDGRNDGLCTLGVLAGVWAGVLAGVAKAVVFVSNVGTEDDDEELGVAGTAVAGAAAAAAAAGAAGAAAGAAGAGGVPNDGAVGGHPDGRLLGVING